jgi:hypothetical protein
MRALVTCLALSAATLVFPALAAAQATLAGTVTDGSGALIPGVTVEASSPALIDKSRTTVTDDGGRYRIVDLPPGLYRVTFSIAGFSRVVRDAIDVHGSGVFTIPVELHIGNVSETVTVSVETPVVNTQGVQRETVLRGEFIQELPATRHYSAILQMIPAINVGFAISAETTPEMQLFSARGGEANEGRITVNGLTVAAPFGGGGVSSVIYNTTDVDEIQVQISGGLGEVETGGPQMNIIPRSGGNTFRGSAFLSTAGEWSRSENIDDNLRSIGITRGSTIKAQWDTNASYGGPVKRDRLWFYGTIRQNQSGRVEETSIRGNLNAGNRNAADPNSWLFRLDPGVEEVRNIQRRNIYSGRLTGQAGRHRLMFSREHQYRCDGSTVTIDGDGCRQRGANWTAMGALTTSPEAAAEYFPQPYYTTQATWTMPKTNKLLLEAGVSRLAYEAVFGRPASDTVFDAIPVTEQIGTDAATGIVWAPRGNVTYRALDDYTFNFARNNNIRASASYVTGSHSMKAGYQAAIQLSNGTNFINTNPGAFEYQFNRGVPNQFTINLPDWETADRTVQHSLFVQDSWTRKRLTVQGAIRFDRAYSWSPADGNGTDKTSPWNAQPIRFDRTVSVRGYNDVTTRWGLAYDLFGTGKTALKFNVGKYLDSATNDENYTRNNPATRIQRTLTRTWSDNDGDRVVDCQITNFEAQGPTSTDPALRTVDTCGTFGGNNRLFGNPLPVGTTVNPAVLGGWGVRPWDWQVGVAVQQEVLPRVSIEVAYNRRWWGNYTVTDNQAITPGMYDTYTVVAPSDSRLPDSGGYPIRLWTLKPEFAGLTARNYVTFETDFGPARTHYWHGIEITGTARTRWGLQFQGGSSIGRTIVDRCESLPNIDSPSTRDCLSDPPARPNFRGSASYRVPKIDVLVSTITRISPAPGLGASYIYPNSYVSRPVADGGLGRLPNGALATGNTTVALLDNDHRLFADKQHRQIDMRFAKSFGRRTGRRTDIGVDLYNLLIVNPPVAYDGGYDAPPAVNGGQWLQPTTIVQSRFARFNVTVNF